MNWAYVAHFSMFDVSLNKTGRYLPSQNLRGMWSILCTSSVWRNLIINSFRGMNKIYWFKTASLAQCKSGMSSAELTQYTFVIFRWLALVRTLHTYIHTYIHTSVDMYEGKIFDKYSCQTRVCKVTLLTQLGDLYESLITYIKQIVCMCLYNAGLFDMRVS